MLKILQRSSLKIGRLLLWFGLALSFVAAAGLFTLRYWILPDIERFHDKVTELASRAVGLQVKIGKIEADLRWLRPHLVFTNVQLLDAKGHSSLELRRIDNVVSWMTLVSGELRLKALEVDEPDLLVRRDKQGELHVAGLVISGQSSSGKLSDWLLHQSSIILNNGRVTWQDELYDRPALVIDHARLHLDNRGRHHRFSVQLTPPTAVAAPLDVRGDLEGNSFSDLSGWHGEVFTQISQADVSAWGTWITLPDEFNHAKGSLRAWMGVEDGRIKRITADMDMSEVWSRMAVDLPQLNLNRLHGRVGWHELEQGYEVSTTKLVLQMSNGFKLQPTDVHLRLAGSKESPFSTGEMQANAIELDDLSVMSDYIPLGKGFKQKLMDFSPHGHISDLHTQWQNGGRFNVKAHFDNLSLRSVGKLPGVEGISGQINGSDDSGVLLLNSKKLTLDASQILLEPITLNSFSMQSGWEHKRDVWDLKINKLSFANEDLSGSVTGDYQPDANGPGVANINLNLTRANVGRIVKYLPKELLGNSTMAWIQAGLLGGELADAHMALRGDLKDFPFSTGQKGLFHVDAKVDGAIVDYAKGWPRVENARAAFRIDGARLQLDSTSVMVGGVQVQKADITIPDFMSADPLVQVRGTASSETKNGLNFIRHSPIRDIINGFTDNTTAVGEGKLDLQLDIPLSDKPIKLNANYHFSENDIKLDEYIPLAKKVTGDVTVTESSMQAKGVTAQIFGGPATIAVNADASGVKAMLQGRVNTEALRKIDPSPVLKSLNGTAEWNTEVTVKNKQYDVLVTSSLQGLASNLPAPLFKRAHEVIPLQFEMKSTDASKDVMSMKYGDIVSVRLMRVANKLGKKIIKRGYVDFGTARRGGVKDGLWITGSLPLLSVEGWSEVWPHGDSKDAVFPPIDGIDLAVQKTVGYGSEIGGLSIHARNHGGTLTAQLVSKDINGEVSWLAEGNGRIVARLKNAVLAEEAKGKEKETAHAAPFVGGNKVAGSVSWPVIDIAVENFTYHGKQLGRLELHASQVDKTISLDRFSLVNPDGVLTLNGKWILFPEQTHVAAKLELYDTGKMLNRSGYPDTLKGGNGTLDCDLAWSGAPEELMLANLNGQLNLKMSKGQFLKVDPGAGKLLSVLNLQSLPKRITLDFTDVFSTGFEFDDMAGAAQIKKGILMTDDFKINGSAAEVTMKGDVDLVRETQNLRVRVLPAIGNSVSLLAFAAGPAVGAGVFLANKLFRDPLDKLVAFEYNVTGNWIDPQVEKVGQVKAIPNNSNN